AAQTRYPGHPFRLDIHGIQIGIALLIRGEEQRSQIGSPRRRKVQRIVVRDAPHVTAIQADDVEILEPTAPSREECNLRIKRPALLGELLHDLIGELVRHAPDISRTAAIAPAYELSPLRDIE